MDTFLPPTLGWLSPREATVRDKWGNPHIVWLSLGAKRHQATGLLEISGKVNGYHPLDGERFTVDGVGDFITAGRDALGVIVQSCGSINLSLWDDADAPTVVAAS